MTPEARIRYENIKTAAYGLLTKAVKTGRLVPPAACSCCGEKCRPHGHHTDYSNPLDVLWLCYWCHRQIHPGRGAQPSKPFCPCLGAGKPSVPEAIESLSRRRRRIGVTPEALAVALEVTVGTIFRWESGRGPRKIRKSTLRAWDAIISTAERRARETA